MVTYAELAAEPPSQIWQQLRSLRSRKVGAAIRGERREIFDTALEQAEQLFAAAAVAGTATRPLLLFYGLSQLGRSIAAASPGLASSDREYFLTGHGIDDGRQLQGAATRGLGTLTIQGKKSGAFPTVAKALSASPMLNPLPLSDLWGVIPYADRFPLPEEGSLHRLTLTQIQPGITDGLFDHATISGLPMTLRSERGPDDLIPDEIIRREKTDLENFLGNYPALRDSIVPSFARIRPPLTPDGSRLAVSLTFPAGALAEEEWPERAPAYHGARYIYPSLDESEFPSHPFMVWWAVLYPLSRLARYYPNVWGRLISISDSSYAAPIEFILGEAIRAVPELALRALVRLA